MSERHPRQIQLTYEQIFNWIQMRHRMANGSDDFESRKAAFTIMEIIFNWSDCWTDEFKEARLYHKEIFEWQRKDLKK